MKQFLLVLALFTMSSCASIVSESEYPVSIQSSPSDTRFMIKDEQENIVYSGRTPNLTKLEASDGYFSKAHYTVEFVNGEKKIQKQLTPTLDNWYWGNVLLGGIIGWFFVDPVTGAMYELPEKMYADVNSLYPNGPMSRVDQNSSPNIPFNQNINVNVTVNSNGEVVKPVTTVSE